jgi:hypothetical protein
VLPFQVLTGAVVQLATHLLPLPSSPPVAGEATEHTAPSAAATPTTSAARRSDLETRVDALRLEQFSDGEGIVMSASLLSLFEKKYASNPRTRAPARQCGAV